jgi:Ca2+-binding EF-hand superfamily protein
LKASNVFKFLDIEEKGLLDYVGFVAVLDRIGCKFTDKECKALFYKHSNGASLLGYQDLCGLFFNMGSGNKDNTNVAFEMSRTANGHVTSQGMTKKLH